MSETAATKTGSGKAGAGRHVALLRGINVGGKNLLPMKDLAKMFEVAGCGDVSTYIASGNVIFRAPAALLPRLPALISAAISRSFDLKVPVLLRSGAELREVLQGNPFVAPGAELDGIYVAFLDRLPAKARVASLDPQRSPGDEFRIQGREIYLRLTTGAAKTKLTNVWFDSQLDCVSTFRNWRTTGKLAELASS